MGLKLFLDDNRPSPTGWTPTRTAEEAKLHLLHGDVDNLSLDCDLDAPHCPTCQFSCGHRGGAAPNSCSRGCSCHRAGDETGGDLLHWMVQTGRWPHEKPTVHSHNLVESLKMKKLIDEKYPKG